MLRTVVAENRCEQLWQNLHANGKFCYGLVIGLPSIAGPDYVIHLAVTKPPAGSAADADSSADEGGGGSSGLCSEHDRDATVSSTSPNLHCSRCKLPSDEAPDVPPPPPPSAAAMNLPDVLAHALDALRMMPGSCYVLGLFTIEPEMPALNGAAFQQQKKVLRQLAVELQNNKWIYGSTDEYDYRDKFLFNYAGGTAAPRCTNVPCTASAVDIVGPLRLTVEPKPIQWVSFYSQLDEPFEFRIARRIDGTANLEENVWECVRTLSDRLRYSKIFMEADAALNAPGVSVNNYLKLHKDDSQVIRTRLYFEVEDPVEGELYGATRQNGYIRCMGEVSACVFAHPTQMIADIDRYLKNDLLRSVSGRLRLLVDAYPDLAEDQRLHCLGRMQPPRRVYFWPFLGSRIQFSDYLFAEEDAEVAVVNAKQVFGVTITAYAVNQKREKMREPKSTRPYPVDPELPKLAERLLNGTHLCCNFVCIMTMVVVTAAIVIGLYLSTTHGTTDDHVVDDDEGILLRHTTASI